MRSRLLWLVGLAAAVALGGCAQPGSLLPLSQSEKVGVATSRITVACGTADELTAFEGSHPPGLADQESIAISGVRKLAAVYAQNRSRLYEGESLGAVVHDTISLLGTCRLGRARSLLIHDLARRP